MAFKISYIFDDGNDHGWTENWYCNQSPLATVMAAAQLVSFSRLGLCGTGVYIKAIRVVDEANPGASRFVRPAAPPPGGLGEAGDIHDYARNAILLRVNAGTLYKRQMWLRGVADDWIIYSKGGKEVAPAAMIASLSNFLTVAINNQFALKCIDKSATNNPVLNISDLGIEVAAPNRVLFTTLAAHNFVPGQPVRISKVSGQNLEIAQPYRVRTLNTTWIVSSVPSATTFTINLHHADMIGAGALTPVLLSVPQVRSKLLKGPYPQITSAQFVGFSSKKTGLPFGPQRGRRSLPRRR